MVRASGREGGQARRLYKERRTPPMPIAETAFAAITPELAEWLDMLVAQRPRKEIAVAFGLADSTVRDRFLKLETLAGCADQRELARWLLENKKAWLLCGL
jgi:DNA invertase Pin-like site-specific DNA recombinase